MKEITNKEEKTEQNKRAKQTNSVKKEKKKKKGTTQRNTYIDYRPSVLLLNSPVS